MEYKSSPIYQTVVIAIDTFIAACPILILSIDSVQLNNNWYFNIICLNALSCIDPFFMLLFAVHKISEAKRKMNIFKLMISFFIVLISVVLPMQSFGKEITVEASNDLMFITFSVFCFGKLITITDEIFLKNRIIKKVFELGKQLWPFIVKMAAFYLLSVIFYGIWGQLLFGGKINSFSVYLYNKQTGINMKDKYQYFHFNDMASAFLTLLVILFQNNWLFVIEQLYFVNNSITTTIFIVTYNFFVVYILIALIYGMTSRLIALYFEDDFKPDNMINITTNKDKEDESDLLESGISKDLSKSEISN